MSDGKGAYEPRNLEQGLLRYTAGCPCDRCPQHQACATSGRECPEFRVWVRTGRTDKERRG